MTMIQIAEIYPDFLYTFISQYGVNEWDDAYDKLTDIEFLENFFSDNENDLLYGYYQGRVSNVTDALLLTIYFLVVNEEEVWIVCLKIWIINLLIRLFYYRQKRKMRISVIG